MYIITENSFNLLTGLLFEYKTLFISELSKSNYLILPIAHALFELVELNFHINDELTRLSQSII